MWSVQVSEHSLLAHMFATVRLYLTVWCLQLKLRGDLPLDPSVVLDKQHTELARKRWCVKFELPDGAIERWITLADMLELVLLDGSARPRSAQQSDRLGPYSVCRVHWRHAWECDRHLIPSVLRVAYEVQTEAQKQRPLSECDEMDGRHVGRFLTDIVDTHPRSSGVRCELYAELVDFARSTAMLRDAEAQFDMCAMLVEGIIEAYREHFGWPPARLPRWATDRLCGTPLDDGSCLLPKGNAGTLCRNLPAEDADDASDAGSLDGRHDDSPVAHPSYDCVKSHEIGRRFAEAIAAETQADPQQRSGERAVAQWLRTYVELHELGIVDQQYRCGHTFR